MKTHSNSKLFLLDTNFLGRVARNPNSFSNFDAQLGHLTRCSLTETKVIIPISAVFEYSGIKKTRYQHHSKRFYSSDSWLVDFWDSGADYYKNTLRGVKLEIVKSITQKTLERRSVFSQNFFRAALNHYNSISEESIIFELTKSFFFRFV